MKIRSAIVDDVNVCLNISMQENETNWTKQDFAESITNVNSIFLVAEEESKVVGYVIGYIVPTKKDEAMLHETRIDVNYRGKKIVTKLVQEFCNQAFCKKVKVVYALIENQLKPFYVDSCDFKETGKWVETSKRKSK